MATEPEKQQLAYELIRTFLNPSIHSNWSQFAGFLPTTRPAMILRDDDSAYSAFLEDILEDRAVAIPNGPVFADFYRNLEAAYLALLSGDKTAEEAIALIRTSAPVVTQDPIKKNKACFPKLCSF